MPRKSENVPRVTISGGAFSLVIIAAFKAPPRKPMMSVTTIANQIGEPPSRQRPPITTADNPIIEPTERSIPPVMMIGVITNASSPISTLRRVISNRLPDVMKLFPVRLKTISSPARTTSNSHSLFGNSRSRHGWSSLSCAFACEIEMSIFFETPECYIGSQSRQNDRALYRFFPKRIDTDKRQCRADRSQQSNANKCADKSTAPAGDRRAAHNNGRDSL